MSTGGIGTTGGKPPPPAGEATREKKGFDITPFVPYLFMAPYLLIFGVFILFPALFGIFISFHQWDYALPEHPWVGLTNYLNLFDPDFPTSGFFWNSMEATGKFTLYSVPLLVVIPLLIALVLNQNFPGRGFFRALYFAPYVLGVAVIGVLFQFMLAPGIGLVNYYLGQLGLPSIPWTNELPWAWVALVGMTIWWTLGFNAIIYLAGLQDIDPALYDAAKVDGANRWQRFWNVTLPGLRPVLLFVVTVTILASANMFGQAYLVTAGAPGNETRTAIMYIAEEGLANFRMGSAAAMSYILAIILIIIGFLNFKFLGQREDQG